MAFRPSDPDAPPQLPGGFPNPYRWLFVGGTAGVILAALLVFVPLWIWVSCRIEPGEGEIAVLIRKTGKDLPPTDMIATQPGYKGIQLDVLPEGRYFRNPYTWSWKISKMTDIPAGKFGVVTRLYGKDLPAGQILAQEGTKGILAETLAVGKHRINPYAFNVQIFDATHIKPGCVGVVTSLVGQDPLDGSMPEDSRNTFTVGKGMKGVLTEVLDPGSYYLNPYMFSTVEVNLQSQRFELGGDDAITFLTADGFEVKIEGTLEFALLRDKAALLTHQVGDMDDILKKIILPRARGFSRIEGSKNPALNYIVGQKRQTFQDTLENHLRDQCKELGVAIKSVLIRNITAPEDIASIIREREVAVQNAKMFDQQIEQARSKAELVRQEMLAVQNKEKVQAQTQQIQARILADQEREVRLTDAQKGLSVAKLENEAAEAQAAAILAQAAGEQAVIRATAEAEAGVLKNQATAFGSGMNYARYLFYRKVAPNIGRILSTDDAQGFGGMFTPFMQNSREGSR